MATKVLVAQKRFNSKVHLATNTKGKVIKIIGTDGTKADYKIVFDLIKDIKTDILTVNCVCGTNKLLNMLKTAALRLLFLQNLIGNPNEILILIYIVYIIFSKIHF